MDVGLAQHRKPPVTEPEQVPCRPARAAACVDPHVRVTREPRLVHEHEREPALERRLHGGMRGRHRAHGQRADDGVTDAVTVLRHEQQPEPVGLDRAGDAPQQQRGGGILERLRHTAREQEPDAVRAARAQAPRRRIGPCVAELGGRREDPLAQLRGELVGAVVCVRDRRAGDAERVGDRLQRDAARRHDDGGGSRHPPVSPR